MPSFQELNTKIMVNFERITALTMQNDMARKIPAAALFLLLSQSYDSVLKLVLASH